MLRVLSVTCIALGAILLAACTEKEATTAAEEAYLAELLAWFDEGQTFGDGTIEIVDSADPFSASTQAKAMALSVAADAWRDEALGFDAPAKFDEVQMWVERAGMEMADALEDLSLGLRSGDFELLYSATDKMSTATGYIENARESAP